ncbi:MAG TPA: hypothetical protein VIL36_05790 [Acidimicrobiales bacterium]
MPVLHRTVRPLLAGALVALAAVAPAGARPAPDPRPDRVPVPDGFRAQALTWTSPQRGWALGVAPCPGAPEAPEEPAAECTTVIATHDGGATWSMTGTLASPIAPPGEPGVTGIDFADARHGWAFGPSFERTVDGGRTWSPAPMPGDGQQVLALVADGGLVHAVVSDCAPGQPPYECPTPPSLWTAPAAPPGTTRWRPVTDVELPHGSWPILAAHGRSTYVVGQQPAPDPDAFYAAPDGRTWSPRPSPCDKEGAGDVLADVAPTSRRDVALLCVGSAGFSKAAKRAFRSADGARTTTPAGITPEWGIASELAATPGPIASATLAVASTSSGSWLYVNDTGGEAWTTAVEEGDGGAGWRDLTFADRRTGWVVYAPAAGYPGTGTLLSTDDGGRTWAPAPL